MILLSFMSLCGHNVLIHLLRCTSALLTWERTSLRKGTTIDTPAHHPCIPGEYAAHAQVEGTQPHASEDYSMVFFVDVVQFVMIILL